MIHTSTFIFFCTDIVLLLQYQDRILAFKGRIHKLEEGIEIMRSQLPHPEPLFLDSFLCRDVENDMSGFVQDVNRFE